MKINLNDATVLGGIAKAALRNNRVLGFLSGNIVAAVLGGEALGGGNKPIQWRSPEGVLHAMGTGDVTSAFIVSNNKGTGRGGKQLKEGDRFCHLTVNLNDNSLTVKTYTRKEVENLMG